MAITTAKFTALGATAFFAKYPVTRIVIQASRRFNPVPDATKPPGATRPTTSDDLEVVDKTTRIKYLEALPFVDPNLQALGAFAGPGQTKTAALRVANADAGGMLPVFWLPYDLNSNRRITLVDKQGVGNVNLFVTDLVDGCSIYIQGTPNEPTVTHLNANKELPLGLARFPDASDGSPQAARDRQSAWTHKWNFMDNRFVNEGAAPKRVAAMDPALVPSRKLEAQHYMLLSQFQRDAFEQTLPNLQALGTLPPTINGLTVDRMETVFTQGTVFGFRTGPGNPWQFHVQRRAMLKFYHREVIAAKPLGKMERLESTLANTFHVKHATRNTAATFRYVPLGAMWFVRSVPQFWP
jgi:hypothetical protein